MCVREDATWRAWLTPSTSQETPQPANHWRSGERETQTSDTCELIYSCCLTTALSSHPTCGILWWQPRKITDIPTSFFFCYKEINWGWERNILCHIGALQVERSMRLSLYIGLLQWLSGKEPTCNAEDAAGATGLISESGRTPGEVTGNPLQYSCLGNSMDSPWGHKRVRHDLRTQQQHFLGYSNFKFSVAIFLKNTHDSDFASSSIF